MKWISHIAIAGAICAVLNPAAVPGAVLGSTAPDWFEKILNIGSRKTKHRSSTHYLIFWVAVMLAAQFVWDWRGVVFWFGFGGLVHWFCDALTITGAPIGPWSARRTTLFGGRVKTGSSTEYIITFCVCLLCALLIWQRGGVSAEKFVPFFPDWYQRYQDGVVDAKEWKDNRFNIF